MITHNHIPKNSFKKIQSNNQGVRFDVAKHKKYKGRPSNNNYEVEDLINRLLSITIMKLDVITETLSNLEIAERQLDRAISLFFFEKDFISALTLAGAAEEILGKLLKLEKNRPHSLESLINGALILNGVPPGHVDEAKSRQKLSDMLNYFKNRLKHYNDQGSMTFSVDYYAAEIIDRASTNYFLYTGNETKLMEKFKIEVLLGGNA